MGRSFTRRRRDLREDFFASEVRFDDRILRAGTGVVLFFCGWTLEDVERAF